jgi:hypothetical protein
MSLKAVHVLFIVLSIALTVMMGVWAAGMYISPTGSAGHLGAAVLSLLAGVALSVYAVKFVRKARRIGLQ